MRVLWRRTKYECTRVSLISQNFRTLVQTKCRWRSIVVFFTSWFLILLSYLFQEFIRDTNCSTPVANPGERYSGKSNKGTIIVKTAYHLLLKQSSHYMLLLLFILWLLVAILLLIVYGPFIQHCHCVLKAYRDVILFDSIVCLDHKSEVISGIFHSDNWVIREKK